MIIPFKYNKIFQNFYNNDNLFIKNENNNINSNFKISLYVYLLMTIINFITYI